MTQGNPRARLRDLGIHPGLLPPGPYNAITDVPGVRVGHATLVAGDGPLVPGKGPVRTGVTAVVPQREHPFLVKSRAVVHVINGSGECTGAFQVNEWGLLESPVFLTNTLSVGTVYDAAVQHILDHVPASGVSTWVPIPMVSECSDAYLNDIRGRHVRPEHVFQALEAAAPGPVDEGSVGAGTGMTAFGFKGGIGTASRRVPADGDRPAYVVGAVVLANYGRRQELMMDGVPVGRLVEGVPAPAWPAPAPASPGAGPAPRSSDAEPRGAGGAVGAGDGSCVVVLATDAPVSLHQLRRLAARGSFGLARTGSVAHHGSGEFVVAFSVADPVQHGEPITFRTDRRIPDEVLGPFFLAVVEAVEEAVYNALCRAGTMAGRDGLVAHGLPVDQVVEIFRRQGRAVEAGRPQEG